MNVIQKAKILLTLIVVCAGCTAPEAINEHRAFVLDYVSNNPDIQSQYLHQDNFRLHYRIGGNPDKAVVVLIHGTPGSWSSMGRLFADQDFMSEVMLVSFDRPGWGLSQLQTNPRVMPGFDEQSRYIEPLLKKLDRQYPELPIILVGHSWGGSLAPYLTVENPELVDGLVVLAGGLDPDLVKPRWYNWAASMGVVSYFLDPRMRAANDEVYALASAMREMETRWDEIDVPVIVVQGSEDELVHPGNADYASAKLLPGKSKVLVLQNQGHFLHVERSDLTAKCVIAMADGKLEDCED